ncbi:MAG: folylpolyglutamate synthase/dihydrofolate synthase family protein [Nitrospirota bacterium]
MSYSAAIRYLYNLQKEGIKFGLENTIRLMSAFGNPHESFTSIHIAGTNGKGSTSAIIANLLRTAGFKVGLFTSPHLVSFTERITVDGEEIKEEDVAGLTDEIRGKISNFSPTFFEVVTSMAFLYFKKKKIDVGVIEVGMGGRLDATNIIKPEVSVITSVSHDHREFLGNTLKEIANEKAGIIKEGIPVVTSHQEAEAMEIIEKRAKGKNALLFAFGRDFSSILKREDLSGLYFDYYDFSHNSSRNLSRFTIPELYLPLLGEYQIQNASVGIKAVTVFLNKKSIFPSPNEEKIVKLIGNGLATTRWPGRLEFIKKDPPILVDGAHNPAAASALSGVLKKIFLNRFKRIIIVLGILGDKDIEGIMRPLLPLASEIIFTVPDYERAASPARLSEVAASLGFLNVQRASTVREAVKMAMEASVLTPDSLIVITGSFYTIGEAKEALGQKGVLRRLRE